MRFTIAFLLLSFFGLLHAQESVTYQKPSEEILALADFKRPPSVMLSPDKQWMVLSYRATYKSLEELNQQEVRLAGLRINPITNISSRVTYVNDIRLKRLGDDGEVEVSGLPEHPRIANMSFSPDDKFLALTHTAADGVELWVVELETAQARKLTDTDLNAAMGRPYTWYGDGNALLISKLPTERPALIDSSKDLPIGPIVSTSDGQISQLRTYQDLLKNPHDEANFETLAQSELYTVNLEGQQSKFLDKALYDQYAFSPDGQYLLVTVIKRPFSYVVSLRSFPQETTVYDLEGNPIKVVNEVPLNEIQPKGFSSTRKGKRHMYWRGDKPASLYYVEALDGGDASQVATYRDELFSWEAPFDRNPVSLVKVTDRFSNVIWGDDEHALIYTSWYDTRSEKIFALNPKTKDQRLVLERNSQDRYKAPGDVYTARNGYGRHVIYMDKNNSYWVSDGYTKEGQFPYIAEMDWSTLNRKHIYTVDNPGKKEDIVSLVDVKKGDILVSIQSQTEYPNFYLKNIRKNKVTALTAFKNPFQSLEGVYKEVIHYKRNDGVNLSGTLYLPAGYDREAKSAKLPLLIWAYPTEYKDRTTAGQSTANPHAFTFPSYGSFVYWVTKGYAVLDNAAFPIIGEGEEEPNDTFIEQLIANGAAAIDAVDNLGYIDKSRVGVGGHSYGAFMTANLLSHSDLFAVGIARSGAYNRTLTPFGFQREQRNYWDDPGLYNRMSPFMNAEKMKTPMLLIHGDADNNPGTFTLQTERYFQALKNLGAPVRMVLLPLESHGYAAEENILHTLWEQDQFLEKYLKKN
ncbi:S9 family peptidase [Sphingobacterium haloxyli]|uniref:S9 family peptidase n=1 Tax=Sphingobacterium haloxyli TaxID=2100533 RepID=A0A2S9J985_9SPHI|nr:prolyl oligopeptidase family serine peptidase [Sphingobacterium haloxyli]PRD49332.1 S9 family peptidase [Sphingobacterium haloxyli]